MNGMRSKLYSNDKNGRVRTCFWLGGRGRMKRLGLNDRICPRRPYSNSMLSMGEGSVDDVIGQGGTKDRAPTRKARGITIFNFS
jgi:hypothetical protein